MIKLLKSCKLNRKGFTLIELMAVVVILGILTAFAVPKVIGSISKAKEKTDNANITTLQRTVNRVYAEEGSYPASLDELVSKGYMESIPDDPVGNARYNYDNISGVVSHGGH